MNNKKSSLPPATAYHRWPVRVLNVVLRALNSVGLARVNFNQTDLIEKARKQSGLEDFGDESFRGQLGELLHCLNEQAELNPVGKLLTRMSLVRILRHRLMVQDLLQKHPEILERTLAPPVVVVGLGRSGTTRLHRLLASDERFLHLKSWETVNPVPYPESYGAVEDPRKIEIEKALKAVMYLGPQIAAVHPLGADEVEEEVGLLQHGFSSQLFELLTKVPGFAEYLEKHDQIAAYEYMLVLLKIISWFRDDPQDKPWVLKTPQHMQDLDCLIRVFPDAKIIFTHRDPVKVVGSCASMAWNALVRDTDSLDPFWVGQDWSDKTERMLHKTQRVREEMIPAENQYDLLYADISSDWKTAMIGVYQFLDLPPTEQAMTAMESWLAVNAQHKHGAHKYDLADFGLDAQEQEQRFAFYRERYAIPYEVKRPT
ncbi:MAG: sulfotransferase [Pseudomonadales bacterium]